MRKVLAAAAAILVLAMVPMRVSATTVADVVSHAYAVGLPDSDIQACINQYGGGTYTSEQCDKAIAALDAWAAARDQQIAAELEIEANVTAEDSAEDTINNNSASSDGTTAGNSSSDGSSDSASVSDSAQTAGSGISESDFIAMTLDEKKSYLMSLTEEERVEFVTNMTNDEKNNILKQLSTSSQLEVIASLIDVGDAFGISYSVDSVSDDAIVLSARDSDGNIVSVSTYGETVEKTGYSYTLPIVLGISAVGAALVGFGTILGVTARRRKREEESAEAL